MLLHAVHSTLAFFMPSLRTIVERSMAVSQGRTTKSVATSSSSMARPVHTSTSAPTLDEITARLSDLSTPELPFIAVTRRRAIEQLLRTFPSLKNPIGGTAGVARIVVSLIDVLASRDLLDSSFRRQTASLVGDLNVLIFQPRLVLGCRRTSLRSRA